VRGEKVGVRYSFKEGQSWSERSVSGGAQQQEEALVGGAGRKGDTA
jgi:hypothetical protein